MLSKTDLLIQRDQYEQTLMQIQQDIVKYQQAGDLESVLITTDSYNACVKKINLINKKLDLTLRTK